MSRRSWAKCSSTSRRWKRRTIAPTSSAGSAEPARNLHPTLQRRLLDEIRRAPGQFILTTHSPYLVSIGDTADTSRLLRLELRDGTTRASPMLTGGSAADVRLHKVLGESADARALLFARGVVLVEGGTELGALPEWFAKSATAQEVGTRDVLNVAIFSVDGDGFEAFIENVAPGRLDAAEAVVGKSKPRKGRHVATATDCPAQIDALYASLLARLGVAET